MDINKKILHDFLLNALDAYEDKDKLEDQNGLHFEFGDYTYSISYGDLKNNLDKVIDEMLEMKPEDKEIKDTTQDNIDEE